MSDDHENEDGNEEDFDYYPDHIPSEEELRQERVVDDTDEIYSYMRGDAIVEFNDRFKQFNLITGLTNDAIVDNPLNPALDHIITIEKVKELVAPHIKKTDDDGIIISYIIIGNCVEELIKNLYYSVCTKLTDAGILEMIFDEETQQFAWRPSKKCLEGLAEEGKEQLKKDPNNKVVKKKIFLDEKMFPEPKPESKPDKPPKSSPKKPKKKKDDDK